MKITVRWLEEKGACSEAITTFKSQSEKDPIKLIIYMLKSRIHLDWASWLIARILKRNQRIKYAVYAANQVIRLYEIEYPGDSRPGEAIKAAKACVKRNSKIKRAAAYDAANAAAYAAAYTADNAAYAANAVANAAANNAAYAAYAAANAAADNAAADNAAYAAYAANAAANAVAYAAAYTAANAVAYADVKNKMRMKILKYGLRLLKS